MKEYRHRIINSLVFHILMPLSAIVLIAGLALYLFVLSYISDFAGKHIENSFLDISNDIYNICDKSLNELLKKRLISDDKAVRVQKGVTIGMIEDFMNEKALKGSIFEKNRELLRVGDIPAAVSVQIEKTSKEYTVSSREYGGNKYYASHIQFEPWNWHIIFLKDEAAYSALQQSVRKAYRITFAILISAIVLSLFILDRYIRNPIRRIITSLKEGKEPEYKGVYEFEFLSNSLRDIMRQRQEMETRLFQAQKLEAIGTLAGGVAHDFNNMLQAIIGYTSLLKMKISKDDPTYDPLDVIEQSANRAAGLTRQLLGFARKGKYVVCRMNINEIANDVLKIIKETFNRAIEIKTLLSSDLCLIDGDKSQIEHVLLNICLNARDAMPAGGTLYIETSNGEIKEEDKPYPYMKAGKYAVIKITDTGPGMDKETQKRIFEPFFTTKEVGKGTGMGLAMAYGIVKNHDGFITVDSEPGKGSTFTIYFPAKEEEIAQGVEKPKELHRGTGTILVVDDEESIRSLAKDALQGLGYKILEASDGQEALDLYKSKKDEIGLIILDLIMPRMGGSEALEKLKEINPDVKILISTGYGVREQVEKMIDYTGAVGVIQKPYNIIEMAGIIKKVLSTA